MQKPFSSVGMEGGAGEDEEEKTSSLWLQINEDDVELFLFSISVLKFTCYVRESQAAFLSQIEMSKTSVVQLVR